MKVHLLITLNPSIVLHETTAAALDLHTTACLGLNMLDIAATRTDDFRAEVETRNRLEVDRDALIWPLATTEGVPLWLLTRLILTTTESTLVDQLGELLLHELIDLLNGFLEAIFRGAGNVEVERWVLRDDQCDSEMLEPEI